VQWHDLHGWPGGPLALLRGASDVERHVAGLPLRAWGRSPEQVSEVNGWAKYPSLMNEPSRDGPHSS
jgi:hypothetical protein